VDAIETAYTHKAQTSSDNKAIYAGLLLGLNSVKRMRGNGSVVVEKIDTVFAKGGQAQLLKVDNEIARVRAGVGRGDNGDGSLHGLKEGFAIGVDKAKL